MGEAQTPEWSRKGQLSVVTTQLELVTCSSAACVARTHSPGRRPPAVEPTTLEGTFGAALVEPILASHDENWVSLPWHWKAPLY
jgi:hypothetical protein